MANLRFYVRRTLTCGLIVPIGLGLVLPPPALALRAHADTAGLEEALDRSPTAEPELWGIRSETQWVESIRDFLRRLPSDDTRMPMGGGLASAHIRHLVFFYPYTLYLGGAPTYQRNCVEALLKSHRGLTLELLYLNFKNLPSRTVLDDLIRNNRLILHGIPTLGDGAADRAPATLAQQAQEVFGTIQRAAPIDLLVINLSTPQYAMSQALMDAADRAQIPTHAYFHGGLITEGTRYLLQRADVAVTNSEAYHNVFQQLGTDVEVLRPVADLSSFLDPWTEEDQRALHGLLSQQGLLGKRLVVHPGVVKEGKGQRDTVEAALRLARQHPELADHLAFVIIGPPRVADGDFSEVDQLRRMAQSGRAGQVVLVGPQSREQMRWWYHAADVVLYPTRNEEPFGLVPVEAQAGGTPVIVTDVGGLPETLSRDDTGCVGGLVIPKADPARLADALYTILSDELRRRAMAEAARHAVERRYAPAHTIQQLTASYIEAVERRRTAIPSRTPENLPRIPENPAAVLFNLYAPTDLRPAPGSDQALVEHWKAAWRARLARGRRWWRDVPGYSFPVGFNAHVVNVAYDPGALPHTRLGPFIQLAQTPQWVEYGYRTHQDPSWAGLSYTTMGAFLLEDPDDRNFLVLDNGWPKVPYDSLLVSRYQEPQRLTLAAIRAELRWARRGLVVEFHHPERFFDYLHIHLNDPETVPIARYATTFRAVRTAAGLSLGYTDYPVPHFAIASTNSETLAHAAERLTTQLEHAQTRFQQTVLPLQADGRVVMLFYVSPPGPSLVGLSPLGLIRKTPHSPTSYEDLQRLIQRQFFSRSATAQIQDRFWREWTAAGLEEDDDFIFELARSQKPLTADQVFLINAWVLRESAEKLLPVYWGSQMDDALQELVRWINDPGRDGSPSGATRYPLMSSDFRLLRQARIDTNDPVALAASTGWLLTGTRRGSGGVDGSHRTAWLVMNVLLARAGLPMIALPVETFGDGGYHHFDRDTDPRPFIEFVRGHVAEATTTPYSVIPAHITDLTVRSSYCMLIRQPEGVRTPCELFTTTGSVRIVCENKAIARAVQRLVEEAPGTGGVPGLTSDVIITEQQRPGIALEAPSTHTIFVRQRDGPALFDPPPSLAIITWASSITTLADLLQRALARWTNRRPDSIHPFQRAILRGRRLDLYA